MDQETMVTRIEQVPATQWNRWIEETQGVMVDVREPREWAEGVLPGTERISLGAFPFQMNTLDKETPVLVVCRSGARSERAAFMLAQAGFRRVANLAGGLQALGLAS